MIAQPYAARAAQNRVVIAGRELRSPHPGRLAFTPPQPP
jgi:hypothetical protein